MRSALSILAVVIVLSIIMLTAMGYCMFLFFRAVLRAARWVKKQALGAPSQFPFHVTAAHLTPEEGEKARQSCQYVFTSAMEFRGFLATTCPDLPAEEIDDLQRRNGSILIRDWL